MVAQPKRAHRIANRPSLKWEDQLAFESCEGCYIKTLGMREYGQAVRVYPRPSGLSAGASIVRVALVLHAGLVVVVLVSARRGLGLEFRV